MAGLCRAFNRMTGQLTAQRSELMDAYGQIDERRRFTEAVLSGVSAGVIGLDAQGRIELPNRAASAFWASTCWRHRPAAARAGAGVRRPAATQHAQPGAGAHRRGADRPARSGAGRCWCASAGDEAAAGGRGFVVTFDDITELQSAQRKAAWADVARRIAHEIKNPLTPDPALRRAAEAAILPARSRPIPTLSCNAPTPSCAMSATSAAWWTSSPPSPACRSR